MAFLAERNYNTILATVTWEQVEPDEGKFDFSVFDGILQDARKSNLKLVILWFASWKNGQFFLHANVGQAGPQAVPDGRGQGRQEAAGAFHAGRGHVARATRRPSRPSCGTSAKWTRFTRCS